MNRQKYDDEKRYYVYGLYDPNEKYPFYIGKGTGSQKGSHFRPSKKGYNSYKDRKIDKIIRHDRKPYSKIIFDGLDETEAYDKEWGLIQILKATPECALTNLKESWGEGSAGGESNPMYGETLSEKHKQKISDANSGKVRSSEAIAKQREKVKGEKCHMSKITKAEAEEIKWLALKTDQPYSQIANEYNVTSGNVCHIKKENTWRHVEPRQPES